MEKVFLGRGIVLRLKELYLWAPQKNDSSEIKIINLKVKCGIDYKANQENLEI